jgi:hypothetical protein
LSDNIGVTSQRKYGWRVWAAGLTTGLVCLALVGGSPVPPVAGPDPAAAGRIAGLDELPPPPDGPSWAPEPLIAGGLRALATAGRTGFTLHTVGGEVSFLPGVNLGGTKPGHQPDDPAVNATDYREWFAAMHWLGVRVVRIYTIHPPAFYTELATHNRAHRDRPLYLMHGVSLPGENARSENLYDAGPTAAFTGELRDASAAVSGELVRPPTSDRANGAWTADVGEWLVAWVVGTEWSPSAVVARDRANAAAPVFTGRYFGNTPQASPTERWLAARMDELATAEAAHGRTMPIAFVNWPTTDPLAHPVEPVAGEDLVAVDANNVQPTTAWPGGTFASYHAYPYYPDFQRHEPGLSAFRHDGRADPYAGYLHALQRHHTDMPVMVTEFGVPSSLGAAHLGPLGRDQGGHSEQDAMTINAELLRLIRDVGMAGALLFAWTDEWANVTWNTVNHQAPLERRQLWHDPLTNEQYFGIIATDPRGALDGAPVDESYLHLSIRLPDPAPARVTLGLDVLPALTGAPPPGSTDGGADAAFELDLQRHTGQAWIRTGLDPLPLDHQLADGARPAPVRGWQRYQLIVNRELVIPTTGRRLPAELMEVGALRHGSWDPADPAADSRALWQLNGSALTVRVPWAMAGFGDPSSHQVLVVSGSTGRSVTSPGVDVTISDGRTARAVTRVRWEDWQRVRYSERLKQGAWQLRDALVETG